MFPGLLSFVLRAAHTVLVRPLLFVDGRSPFCFLHQVFRQRVVTDAFCLRSHRDEAWTRSISHRCLHLSRRSPPTFHSAGHSFRFQPWLSLASRLSPFWHLAFLVLGWRVGAKNVLFPWQLTALKPWTPAGVHGARSFGSGACFHM